MFERTSMIFSWSNTRIDDFYATVGSVVDPLAFFSVIVPDRVSVLLLKLLKKMFDMNNLTKITIKVIMKIRNKNEK